MAAIGRAGSAPAGPLAWAAHLYHGGIDLRSPHGHQ